MMTEAGVAIAGVRGLVRAAKIGKNVRVYFSS